MADIYSALMGLPTEQDQMQALAQRLRRRSDLATIGVLSGDPVLSQWGAGELERAQEQAKSLKPSPMSLGLGVVSRGARDPEAQALYERRLREGRAFKKALAESKRETGFEDWFAKKRVELGWPTRSQATASRQTAAYLPELKALATEFASGVEIPDVPEAAAEFARQYLPLGEALAPKLEAYGMTPEAIEWLERGRQTESDVIRLASGLAVTGFELQNVKKWSPWALGLSPKQRVDRMRNIYNKLGREAAAVFNQPWEPVDFTPETLGLEPEEPTSAAEVPAPTYARSLIPKGTRTTTDPDTGKEVAVDPTTGRMWELD